MTKGTRQVIRDLVVRSLVIAVGLGLLLPHSAAIASSDPCTHGNHQIWLTSGGASPGSGTTSTAFTFSVTLTDSAQKSCSPSVTVTVVGAGTFTLSPPTGANYQAGVVFRVSRTLPVGTHAYSFAASSGTGSGATSATLMQVTPTSVVVSAQPTPSATPKPSPKPTPAPTARPTPSKAQTAATTAAPKATKKPKSSTSSKPKATVMPRPTPASLGAAPVAIIDGGPTDGPSGGGSSLLDSPQGMPGIGPDWTATTLPMASMLATIGAALAFVLLASRRRRSRGSALVTAAAAVASGGLPGTTPEWPAARPLPPDTPFEEALMPRWRRPSVLAARQASSRDAPIAHVPEKFTGAPEEGHTRGRIGYRLVRVSSVPDEILGEEVGRLDRDDEVEILRMAGAFRLVRSPSGIEGWIHKTTLSSEIAGDEEVAEAEPAGGDVPSDWSPFGRMPSDQADPQRAGADEAPNLAKKAGRRSRAPSPVGLSGELSPGASPRGRARTSARPGSGQAPPRR